MEYKSLSTEMLQKEYESVLKEYEALKAQNVKLDMSRGKPCKEQLDLGEELFTCVRSGEECYVDNFDIRNYGLLEGIPSCRKLFAEILGLKPQQVFVGGNASLSLMYGVLTVAYISGLKNSEKPWSKLDKVKFLCPSPGYDRHFAMSQSFGAELVTIPMNDDGPDMDAVEEAVKDPSVKGIWCVPKYSNPTGVIYSNEVINRLAALKPAAPDFTIMWDNAYYVHELTDDFVEIPDIIELCAKNGSPEMVFEFFSTSKITFPGAGVSVVASSEENIKYLSSRWGYQTISYDKINQLRHVKYLKDKENVLKIMRQHAAIIRPKFEIFAEKFENKLKGYGIAKWTEPKGGYFMSFDTLPGCAKRTVQLMKEAGIVLTGAGATYPYGKDPEDKNIRIAPTLPPVNEIEIAAEAMCICVKLAALEKLLNK